jgi:hypothetical protein
MKKQKSYIQHAAAAARMFIIPAVTLMISASAFAQTIVSDKEYYSPTETVTLTGEDWKPGDVIKIDIEDSEKEVWSTTSPQSSD